MMKLNFLMLLFIGLGLHNVKAPTFPDTAWPYNNYPGKNDLGNIHYQVRPDFNEKAIEVSFSRSADEKGDLLLVYENESMGETNLFNCLQNLTVQPKAKSLEIVKDSSLIKIKGQPNTSYNISYSIRKDYQQAPLNQFRYRPIVDSTYFHVLGTKLFMYPIDLFENQHTKVSIAIDWNFENDTDLFHSSFGFDKKQQLNISQDELHNSFFVGGDFRRYQFSYTNKPVYFITRGAWQPIKDDKVFQILKTTIHNQYNFWNDSIQTQFSVSLIPTYETNSYSVGGSALTNSFISYASNNKGTTLKGLTWLYNHELMHKWIARTIQIEKDVVHYWFSEGFTDYYAYKLMLKSNDLSLQAFIDLLNKEVVIPHYTDKVATIPNTELTFENYWSNYSTYAKLPYRRGLLYAFLIDIQIKQQSNFTKSLDDLLFECFEKAKQDADFRINETVFMDYLSHYLKEEVAQKQFDTYITEGQLINFEGQLLKGMYVEKKLGVPIFNFHKNQSNKLLKKLQQ